MSEHITHVAILEDCMRLVERSDAVGEPVKLSLRKYPDLARIGSISRAGDTVTMKLMSESRRRWETRTPDDFVEETISYAMGWRCHNAADRHFKPIYRIVEADRYAGEHSGDIDTRGPGESRIYHDIVVFREVYACGDDVFAESVLDYRLESEPAEKAIDAIELESVLGGLFQRSLLANYSGMDTEDPSAWLEMLKDNYQPFTVDLRRYAEAYRSPDLDFMRRFIIENNFYDRSDPLLRLARSLQGGRPDGSIDLEEAVAAAENQSQYAQALRKAYKYVVACSDYLLHRIDDDELHQRLDLGKPHIPRA